MSANPKYALALSLESSKCNPKVVPVEELYFLKGNHLAVPINPKSNSDFMKGVEYGRFAVIDGERKLVRYIIFRLDSSVDALRSYYKDAGEKNGKRFKPPKRQSTAPTIEDAKLYKVMGSQKKTESSAVSKSKAVTSANDDIFKEFKKMIGRKASAASTNDGASSSSQTGVEAPATPPSIITADTESTSSACSLHVHDLSSSNNAGAVTITKTFMNASVQTVAIQCLDVNHVGVQLQLDEALSKYEKALREIKTLRLKRKDEEPIAATLKRLEEKIDNLTLRQSQQDDCGEGKASEVAELPNLFHDESEEEQVTDSDQVRIDEDLWVSRSEILDIEAKYTKLRPRTEAVTTLLCEDQPHLFGISGFTTSGEALLRFTPQMQEAVLKILSAMKWDVIPKGLRKTNVNHRISTFLSATRQVKKEEAKDPNYSPTDGDEDSSDVGKQPPLKKRKEDDLILNDDDTDELLNTSFDL